MTHAPDALVVLGGPDPLVHAPPALTRATHVVAADSGVHLALALGLHIDRLIGDLDSATDDDVARAVAARASIERHPVEKDHTDLELAMQAVAARAPRHIAVLDGGGGRLDHALGNVLCLEAAARAGALVEAWIGSARLYVVSRHLEVDVAVGELISLLPLGGPASGITSSGLRYPLGGSDLASGVSRGVSNVAEADRVVVEVQRGVLLVIRPAPATTTWANPGEDPPP